MKQEISLMFFYIYDSLDLNPALIVCSSVTSFLWVEKKERRVGKNCRDDKLG